MTISKMLNAENLLQRGQVSLCDKLAHQLAWPDFLRDGKSCCWAQVVPSPFQMLFILLLIFTASQQLPWRSTSLVLLQRDQVSVMPATVALNLSNSCDCGSACSSSMSIDSFSLSLISGSPSSQFLVEHKECYTTTYFQFLFQQKLSGEKRKFVKSKVSKADRAKY